jgi:hypothetical protein
MRVTGEMSRPTRERSAGFSNRPASIAGFAHLEPSSGFTAQPEWLAISAAEVLKTTSDLWVSDGTRTPVSGLHVGTPRYRKIPLEQPRWSTHRASGYLLKHRHATSALHGSLHEMGSHTEATKCYVDGVMLGPGSGCGCHEGDIDGVMMGPGSGCGCHEGDIDGGMLGPQ